MDKFRLQRDVPTNNLLTAAHHHRYHKKVFLLAPWKAIYRNDDERTMSYEESLKFHAQIVSVYTNLDYTIITVPEGSVEDRAKFITQHLPTEQY